MYAIKQAMLISGALPMAEITIYYMDIRTFGKGYEQFYQNAKAMGVEFIRGKVASIREDEKHNPIVKVELTEEGRIIERTHDLIVLSLGMIPTASPSTFNLAPASDGFISLPALNASPIATERPGIFVTGTAGGPMDIVDSIITAGSAASEASAYIREKNGTPIVQQEVAYA
jgi:heterodisulfide reductase subunit A